MPTLTCVIPVYNGERFLRDTLLSVARQTRRPDRLVVLDNCSTDGTRALLENFHEFPCERRQNERNIGLLGNANRALGFASETDYLHLLMADDLVTPTFYERLLEVLEPVPGAALGYAYNEVINAEGVRTGPAAPMPPASPRVLPKNEFYARQATLDAVLLPAVLFKVNRRPPPCLFRDLPQTSDCVFLAEWARSCARVIEVRDYLCQYRLHPTNASANVNLLNLQSSVTDEWRAMEMILPWIEEAPLPHWMRVQKMKCLFAARAHVRADMLQHKHPEYAGKIRAAITGPASPLHSLAGRLAVRIRDAVDTLRGREKKSQMLARMVGVNR